MNQEIKVYRTTHYQAMCGGALELNSEGGPPRAGLDTSIARHLRLRVHNLFVFHINLLNLESG